MCSPRAALAKTDWRREAFPLKICACSMERSPSKEACIYVGIDLVYGKMGEKTIAAGKKDGKKGAVPLTENLLSGNQMCYNHVSCMLKKEEKAANYGYHGQSREKNDPVKRFLVY